jgi:hypothetical protein
MTMNEMGKNWILVGIVMVAVFGGMIGTVAAHIETRDLGIDSIEEGIGFIVSMNEVEDIFLEPDEEYNVTGTITVYNDGTLVLEENITLEVISFHGFAVNRPDTREFEINMTEGTHELSAQIESEGHIVEAIYVYDGEVEEAEEEEEVIDWLPCP